VPCQTLGVLGREEDRQQLITALADLPAHIVKIDLLPVLLECLHPRGGVQINRIHEGPIDVEQDCGNHAIPRPPQNHHE
jgi:hypothetical protein